MSNPCFLSSRVLLDLRRFVGFELFTSRVLHTEMIIVIAEVLYDTFVFVVNVHVWSC